MKQPLVSVIVPTKNSSVFLKACLQSIQDQDYPNIELIVVDNNSTDDTKKIAKQFTDKVFNKEPERSTQRNYGVTQATGVYVAIIDSDMELAKTVISACVKQIEYSHAAGIIIPEESFGKGFWAQCKKLERSFYVNVDWMEATRFFSRTIYLQIGGYDEALVSGEDWNFSEQVREVGEVARISEFIYHNEGRLTLGRLLHKKFYYAQKIYKYKQKLPRSTTVSRQMSLYRRYALFFHQPVVLLRQPLLSIGMLFMKTCEFSIGAVGYIISTVRRNKA